MFEPRIKIYFASRNQTAMEPFKYYVIIRSGWVGSDKCLCYAKPVHFTNYKVGGLDRSNDYI